MKWFRSLAAELFPSWHEQRLLKQLKGENYASMDPLARLQRTLGAANVADADRDPAKDQHQPTKLPK